MQRKDSKNFIKYPSQLYKVACLNNWERAFGLLFDLKRIYTFSVIQDYRDYSKIQPLLSKKISARTYFKYLRILTRKGLVKKVQYALILPAYKSFTGAWRYVKPQNYIDRMRAQGIRRLLDKQASKIRTKSSIHEIMQLKVEGCSLAFDVVDLQATTRLSCKTLGNKYGRSNAWGWRLKKRLQNMGLISIKNSKELLKGRPTEYAHDENVRLFRGVWIRQHADQIHCFIDLKEKEVKVKNTLDLRMKYAYGYYDCYD